jgi:hypothetical protein
LLQVMIGLLKIGVMSMPLTWTDGSTACRTVRAVTGIKR